MIGNVFGSFLALSWSPLGAPGTSKASTSDTENIFDANLNSQQAVGARRITSHLALGAPQFFISERLHFLTQDQQQVLRMEEEEQN